MLGLVHLDSARMVKRLKRMLDKAEAPPTPPVVAAPQVRNLFFFPCFTSARGIGYSPGEDAALEKKLRLFAV